MDEIDIEIHQPIGAGFVLLEIVDNHLVEIYSLFENLERQQSCFGGSVATYIGGEADHVLAFPRSAQRLVELGRAESAVDKDRVAYRLAERVENIGAQLVETLDIQFIGCVVDVETLSGFAVRQFRQSKKLGLKFYFFLFSCHNVLNLGVTF